MTKFLISSMGPDVVAGDLERLCKAASIAKPQIPNPKLQENPKHQAPKKPPAPGARVGAWSFVVGIVLGFGIWDLELFHPTPSRLPRRGTPRSPSGSCAPPAGCPQRS